MEGFIKESSDELGFAVSCLYSGAINREEFKLWIYSIIEKYDDIPLYIYDLVDFNDSLLGLTRIIGFQPHWPYDNAARVALHGIACKRGVEFKDDYLITKDQALAKLKKYPHIEERFRKAFPFIDY